MAETKIPKGVYIEDIKGNLYTKDQWSNQATPNSVMVITSECKVSISLEREIKESFGYSTAGKYCTALPLSKAKVDYKGKENSENIHKSTESLEYADGYCLELSVLPNRKACYLPALGELLMIYKNLSKVNECLSACGGNQMLEDGTYWSSTYSDSQACFYAVRFSDGEVVVESALNMNRVRPVADIQRDYQLVYNGEIQKNVGSFSLKKSLDLLKGYIDEIHERILGSFRSLTDEEIDSLFEDSDEDQGNQEIVVPDGWFPGFDGYVEGSEDTTLSFSIPYIDLDPDNEVERKEGTKFKVFVDGALVIENTLKRGNKDGKNIYYLNAPNELEGSDGTNYEYNVIFNGMYLDPYIQLNKGTLYVSKTSNKYEKLSKGSHRITLMFT